MAGSTARQVAVVDDGATRPARQSAPPKVLSLSRVASWPSRVTLGAVSVGMSALLVALAVSRRSERDARIRAVMEKERIRQAFRAAVTEALRNAGADEQRLDHENLQALVDLACERPGVGREVGQLLVHLLAPPPDLAALTRREREVLLLLADGVDDKEIAGRLFLTPGTVRVHVSNITRKLGVRSRQEAVGRLARLSTPTSAAAVVRPPVEDNGAKPTESGGVTQTSWPGQATGPSRAT